MAARIARVFPRRTSHTPLDALAFVGDPPLWRPDADEGIDSRANWGYDVITDQGSERGGFLFKSLHEHLQPHTVVDKAPVMLGLPRAILVGSVGNQHDGGFGMTEIEGKQCSKCGEWKPYEAFYHQKCQKDGHRPRCKACMKSDTEELRQRVKQIPLAKQCSSCGEVKPASAFYRHSEHLDGLHSQCKSCGCQTQGAHYQRKHAVKLAWQQQWRLEHPDQAREAVKRWQEANPDKRRIGMRNWRRKNPERVAMLHARRRARKAGATVERFTRQEIFIRDRGRCHICGKTVDPKRWHLDHLIPLALGGQHSRRNVAVSHPVCNDRKGVRGPAQLRLLP